MHHALHVLGTSDLWIIVSYEICPRSSHSMTSDDYVRKRLQKTLYEGDITKLHPIMTSRRLLPATVSCHFEPTSDRIDASHDRASTRPSYWHCVVMWRHDVWWRVVDAVVVVTLVTNTSSRGIFRRLVIHEGTFIFDSLIPSDSRSVSSGG